jgi:hypothetical protein
VSQSATKVEPVIPQAAGSQPDASRAGGAAVDIAIFVADTNPQEGWMTVPVKDGTLYLHNEPALRLNDLIGIQAGNNDQGEGVLAVDITNTARIALASITTAYANLRLALIVGRTLVAAPTYVSPVDSSRLIFPVGTPQDAEQIVRVVAGDAPPAK